MSGKHILPSDVPEERRKNPDRNPKPSDEDVEGAIDRFTWKVGPDDELIPPSDTDPFSATFDSEEFQRALIRKQFKEITAASKLKAEAGQEKTQLKLAAQLEKMFEHRETPGRTETKGLLGSDANLDGIKFPDKATCIAFLQKTLIPDQIIRICQIEEPILTISPRLNPRKLIESMRPPDDEYNNRPLPPLPPPDIYEEEQPFDTSDNIQHWEFGITEGYTDYHNAVEGPIFRKNPQATMGDCIETLMHPETGLPSFGCCLANLRQFALIQHVLSKGVAITRWGYRRDSEKGVMHQGDPVLLTGGKSRQNVPIARLTGRAIIDDDGRRTPCLTIQYCSRHTPICSNYQQAVGRDGDPPRLPAIRPIFVATMSVAEKRTI